ncbi:hypothetical protein SLE2022_169940 [Rubroshorea leprosula]
MGKGDIETGGALYPTMCESPELRWAFIRKVYTILSVQLLLTAAVAFAVVSLPNIGLYVRHTIPGIVIYILSLVVSLILIFLLHKFHNRHPLNFFLLGLFTISFSFGVGLTCSFYKGTIVFEAIALTSVAVVGLTLYTFWAVKRGHDFSFLGPALFCSILVLLVFSLIQIFIPLGKLSVMIFGYLAATIFCGYIVYDTNELIKRCSYDDYILAAVSLYVDIINLFMAMLTILSGSEP